MQDVSEAPEPADTAKELTPYVIFPDRTTDVLQPFVLDVHSPSQKMIEMYGEPAEITRTHQAISGKTFVLLDDGTIVDENGQPAEGFLVQRMNEIRAAACHDDDAGYAHSDPLDPEDSTPAASEPPDAPFDTLEQQAESRTEPAAQLPPD